MIAWIVDGDFRLRQFRLRKGITGKKFFGTLSKGGEGANPKRSNMHLLVAPSVGFVWFKGVEGGGNKYYKSSEEVLFEVKAVACLNLPQGCLKQAKITSLCLKSGRE